MAVPSLKVYFAPGDTPFDTTPTWVDITAYVRNVPAVSITRGKSPEDDHFQPGHAVVTLSNRDRRFDPLYSAGPYFGDLVPKVQFKIEAVYSAVTYPVFRGWIARWPQEFLAPAGKDATVTIEAFDALWWLAETELSSDPTFDHYETTIGSLAIFLRQAQTSGGGLPENWIDATGNTLGAFLAQGVAQIRQSLRPTLASSSVVFDGATTWGLADSYSAPDGWQSSAAWTVSFWIQTTQAGTVPLAGDWEAHATIGSVGTTVGMVDGTIGVSQVNYTGVTNSGSVFSTTTIVNDGVPHHVIISSPDTTQAAIEIYVDGVPVATTLAGTLVPQLGIDVIGSQSIVPGLNGGYFIGALQDFAMFDAAVTDLYDLASGFISESSTDRITRYLDDADYVASWRDLTTTPRATVGAIAYDGRTVLDMCQEVERTEQGMFFAARDNDVTFTSRYYVQEVSRAATVQQIFSDDGGATALAYQGFGFDFSDPDFANDITVRCPTAWSRSYDQTSIDANGRSSRTVDVILTNATDVDRMAIGLVGEYKDPAYRSQIIEVQPDLNTSRWDDVLGLELGDRIQVEITPNAVGSQVSQEMTLTYIEWQIDAVQWILRVQGSACRDVWFIVGSSLVDGPDLVGY